MLRAASILAVSAVLAACAADAGSPGTSGSSVIAPPRAPEREEVAVAHDRELRGAWISTVFNGNWPSRTGLSEPEAKGELTKIFDALAGARMNTVFFQIRPESDALYRSSLEPWSRFLTGTMGQDPGWDPLAFAVEEGHRRGLEVHAWMNPYRGLTNAALEPAPNHPTKTLASAARRFGTMLWMDPGAPEVRAHILEVIRDVLERYDVDGIHFDDYFYPYPIAGETFDDAATYAVYTKGGGALARDDWRRSNVDALVREAGALVGKTRPDVRFGISPFGIHRPGTPEGIVGLDAYASLFCDAPRWIHEGWVDYLAPQLYWPTTQAPQAFGKLLSWWADLAVDGRSIFVGHSATKAGTGAFTIEEYDAQMSLAREARDRGVRGSIFFSAKPLVEDQAGLRTALAARHWTAPATTPRLASARADEAGAAPAVEIEDDARDAAVAHPEGARAVAVYREGADGFAIDRIVPAGASPAHVTLEAGRWAISVVDRRGVESRGAVVSIP